MVFTACSYLALAGAVWIFLRLLQACFWLPRHLKKQNDVQQMLQEKVDGYEKYILECEEKEKTMLAEGKLDDENNGMDKETLAEKWKERRECLEMLKRELNRVRDGGDMYDWDHLLEEEGIKLNDTDITEILDDENEEKIDNKEETDESMKKKKNKSQLEYKNDSKSNENTEDEREEKEMETEGKKDK